MSLSEILENKKRKQRQHLKIVRTLERKITLFRAHLAGIELPFGVDDKGYNPPSEKLHNNRIAVLRKHQRCFPQDLGIEDPSG